ncbi:hypothetical protein [Acinetobacter gyllenbergii]|uniref:hypothetical protein n=1 Tax=Acinetobacter gyllenbergii TaxID=134534 RepID=UPI000806E49A|nr:hypothetical protein [Acinetobacter gyllenbergii]OBY75923.1 hypothetical protein NG55_04420 [Acinetobacter gyllenbergii]
MNAINFIQQHGVEKAREVVEGAPTVYIGTEQAQLCYREKDKKYSTRFKPSNLLVNVSSLKRLVESVDLVEQFGNDLVGAKQMLEFSKDCQTIELSGSVITVERLKQAIADYEAIYSGAKE